jgi:hypothetical protein
MSLRVWAVSLVTLLVIVAALGLGLGSNGACPR